MDYIVELKLLYWLILLIFYFSVVINCVTVKTHNVILKRSNLFFLIMLILIRTKVFDGIKKYYEQGYNNSKAVELFEVLVPLVIILALCIYLVYSVFKMVKIKGLQKFYLTVKDHDFFKNKIDEYSNDGILVRYEDNYNDKGEYKNTKVIFSYMTYKKSMEYIKKLNNENHKEKLQFYKAITTVVLVAVFDFWVLNIMLVNDNYSNVFDIVKNVL